MPTLTAGDQRDPAADDRGLELASTVRALPLSLWLGRHGSLAKTCCRGGEAVGETLLTLMISWHSPISVNTHLDFLIRYPCVYLKIFSKTSKFPKKEIVVVHP